MAEKKKTEKPAAKPYQNMSFAERAASQDTEQEVEPGYIDLPFESGSADPQPLRYGDIKKLKSKQGVKPATEEKKDEQDTA